MGRRPMMTNEAWDELFDAQEAGFSKSALARTLGVTHTTVHHQHRAHQLRAAQRRLPAGPATGTSSSTIYATALYAEPGPVSDAAQAAKIIWGAWKLLDEMPSPASKKAAVTLLDVAKGLLDG